MNGVDTEDLLTIKYKFYKLLGSPVTSKHESIGAVILYLMSPINIRLNVVEGNLLQMYRTN